ncbi:unnamed protein product [Cuscuta europaea]|uniref:Signal peptidase complex-like protein DTM1 n=1 Tax=Cuscuta europaea TaxID=41803 RepID=A0A9P0ZZK2_CUSEU|nr:unnamed protein product [Cuscuta europaea]
MKDDAVLRASVCWVGAAVVLTGIYTHYSFKKMAATYLFGMFAVCAVMLPDWDFFDRLVSQWFTPLTLISPNQSPSKHSPPSRFRFYPVRTAIYAAMYGVGFYKWWTFVISSS